MKIRVFTIKVNEKNLHIIKFIKIVLILMDITYICMCLIYLQSNLDPLKIENNNNKLTKKKKIYLLHKIFHYKYAFIYYQLTSCSICLCLYFIYIFSI